MLQNQIIHESTDDAILATRNLAVIPPSALRASGTPWSLNISPSRTIWSTPLLALTPLRKVPLRESMSRMNNWPSLAHTAACLRETVAERKIMPGDLSSASHRLIWRGGAPSTMRHRIEPKDPAEEGSDKSTNWTSVDACRHVPGSGPTIWAACVSGFNGACWGLRMPLGEREHGAYE